MQLHIQRCDFVAPGGESWLELLDCMVFTVPADGCTQEGADALEEAWAVFTGSGEWVYRPDVIVPASELPRMVYAIDPSFGWEVAVEVVSVPPSRGGPLVFTRFSPEHFTASFVEGLRRAAQACSDTGWRAAEQVPARRAQSAAVFVGPLLLGLAEWVTRVGGALPA